jgi:hypothetical protein
MRYTNDPIGIYQSLTRGLVGHWSPSVSGPQGNRLMDLSGQNNHGTLTNMDFQTDYVPSAEKGGRMALDFDGVNDRADAGLKAFTGNFSISVWLRYTGSNNGTVIGKWMFGVSSGFQIAVLGGSTNIGFLYGDTSGSVGNYAERQSTTGIGTNVWSHLICLKQSNSAAGLRVFINGQETSCTTVFNGTPAESPQSDTVVIGDRPSNDLRFQGQIDDIRIYNRVLTPNEIRLLAQSRMPETATPQRTRTVFYSSGLISYLRRRSYNSILGSGVLS